MDGNSTEGWRGYNSNVLPPGWIAKDAVLMFDTELSLEEDPIETEATIILHLNLSQKISIENNDVDFDPKKINGLQTGNFKLEEGDYVITITSKN